MKGVIAAIGLALIFIFGTLFFWAIRIHDPIYENGVLIGHSVYKEEAIATFAGLAVLGGCVLAVAYFYGV